MALRNAKPLKHVPLGLSDASDGTNVFRGAQSVLMNLIPDPSTTGAWICRPAATQLTSFSGFNTPGFVSSLLIVGDIAYGTLATARNAGKDEPFSYNLRSNTFNTISNVTNANTPTSPATSGDWTPPILSVVGTRIIFTHPGFPGGATKFGWLDISNFNSASQTGTTHTSTLIDTLSSNVLTLGWTPGMRITGAGIPVNTFIVSIAVGGLSLILSQAATASAAAVALTVSGGTSALPLWGAGDTNINNLPSTPVAVAEMNGRAFFACGSGVVLSDSLIPCQVSNASQALTFANGINVNALAPLPLSSATAGGIVQAIIAFQGVTAIQQITGDFATSNLAVNVLKGGTGTLSPLSITSNNMGVTFVSPEGLRTINFLAQISDPIGDGGNGITTPFIYAQNPSRTAGASTADTSRFSIINGYAAGTPNQEYWYDLTRKVFHGPHTFPANQIQPWQSTFVMAPKGVTGSLWKSDAVAASSSAYTENSVPLSWTYQTILLPDNEEMAMNAMIETTLAIAFPFNSGISSVTAYCADEQGSVIGQALISVQTGAPALWGTAVWGSFIWGGGATKMAQHRVPWPKPIEFKQMSFAVSGNSSGSVKIGNTYLKYQSLGYLIENP